RRLRIGPARAGGGSRHRACGAGRPGEGVAVGTLAEEILGARLGRAVEAGETVVVPVDVVMSHDTTTALVAEGMDDLGRKVAYPERGVVVFDHITPAATIAAAEQQQRARDFVARQGIPNLLTDGISHQVLPEHGLVSPGDVVVGADSHTVTLGTFGAFATGMGSTDVAVAYATGESWLRVPSTLAVRLEGHFGRAVEAKDLILEVVRRVGSDGARYQAVEYISPAATALSIGDRMTLRNIAVEMGGKAGLFAADDRTLEWLAGRGARPARVLEARDPSYQRVESVDLELLEPMVATSSRVDSGRPVRELSGMSVDQVFIGTCTNGRLADFATASKVLKGHQVAVRTVAVPASREVYLAALRAGYIELWFRLGWRSNRLAAGHAWGATRGFWVQGRGR
ncbi:MAG: aconitase/3-isopropylmalate dehydratase large subunit family protein, partial [Candidatus Dormiibacterota bacterium]